MREIEILVKIEEPKRAAFQKLKRLKKLKYAGSYKVVDVYYFNPSNPKTVPNKEGTCLEWLRIRQKGGKCFITHKKDIMKGNLWLYAEEHEVEFSGLANMQGILKALGFRKLVKVTNNRSYFNAPGYEVTFEDVEGLGIYLEVESKSSLNRSPEKIRSEIFSFIRVLGIKVSEELQEGKAELMLKKNRDWSL